MSTTFIRHKVNYEMNVIIELRQAFIEVGEDKIEFLKNRSSSIQLHRELQWILNLDMILLCVHYIYPSQS